MSLINDALKQARQAPPRHSPTTLPPLRTEHVDSPRMAVWVVPAIIIFLIFSAIFFIGWAAAHRSVHTILNTPVQPDPNYTPAEVVTAPQTTPVAVTPVQTPETLPDGPRLQGIFYSPTAPSAILDGKTVRPGDAFKQYKVKEITKYTVTLIGPDKKELKIGMGN